MPALGVPALGHRLGALVGDEVIIDVIHVQAGSVGGQHRRAELTLQRQRVARLGDRRKPGDELSDRALVLYTQRRGPGSVVPVVEASMRSLHRQFAAHRTGPGVRK